MGFVMLGHIWLFILFDFVWQHYGDPLDCDLVRILVILQGCC